MKNILVKNFAKLKTITAMVTFGASALAVNTSLADNWDGLGVKDYHLPSPLSQAIRLNQDGELGGISAATVSGVSEHMTISTAPGFMTVSTAPGLITILPAPGLITISAVPGLMMIPAAPESTPSSELSELMAISDAPGDAATSGLRELRRVFSNHDPKTVFERQEPVAISVVPEPTTIFAGAILLLPLGLSIVRNLRPNKKCGHHNG
jgi:hypothetical protein